MTETASATTSSDEADTRDRSVEAILYGFFPSDFRCDAPVEMTIDSPAEGMIPAEELPRLRIRDARALQRAAREARTPADFFGAHGFVLLDHESAVEDWDADPGVQPPDNAVLRVYGPESEALIRSQLLPGRKLELWQGPPTRRGPGQPAGYANGVHQDFGIGPDDFQQGLAAFTGPEIAAAWRSRYEQDDVEAFVVIDLWRPVGMQGPVRHMPLGLCRPDTVRPDDRVPLALHGITPTGKPTTQLGLRYREAQEWYYYPEMHVDEVLAFNNFDCAKDGDPRRVRACFHSAFDAPDTPEGAEERQSCEHRVNVFVLRD